jgi:hypothetical protein
MIALPRRRLRPSRLRQPAHRACGIVMGMRIRRVRMGGYVSVRSSDEWRAEAGPSMAQRQGKWGGAGSAAYERGGGRGGEDKQMRNVTAGSEVERKSSVGEVRVSSDHKRSGRRVDAPAARTCETGQYASP